MNLNISELTMFLNWKWHLLLQCNNLNFSNQNFFFLISLISACLCQTPESASFIVVYDPRRNLTGLSAFGTDVIGVTCPVVPFIHLIITTD